MKYSFLVTQLDAFPLSDSSQNGPIRRMADRSRRRAIAHQALPPRPLFGALSAPVPSVGFSFPEAEHVGQDSTGSIIWPIFVRLIDRHNFLLRGFCLHATKANPCGKEAKRRCNSISLVHHYFPLITASATRWLWAREQNEMLPFRRPRFTAGSLGRTAQ